jgi:transposase
MTGIYILRLNRDGFSNYAIAEHTGCSLPTIRKYLRRLDDAGISPADALKMDDIALSDCLLNKEVPTIKNDRFLQLEQHFSYAESELKRTGVTRELLWLEYSQSVADPYSYSQYCYHLGEFMQHKEVVMHLEHAAAETIMIDFAGKKLSYVNLESGEVIDCQVFVAVLPHSGLIYCKAVHSQCTYDFMDCINSMLRFYGGCPQTILCDNLKTAVTRPSKYEPVFTDVCIQLSEHYDTTFSATRPYKPRDKAMVERGVGIVYTHVYAPLRNQVFRSIKELNMAMVEQLTLLNNRTYKGSPYSRRQLFNEHEKQLLKILPSTPYTLKKSVVATVQRNYHVQLSEDHHYYSVPYTYVGKKVKVLYDQQHVEIYFEQKRIAAHIRSHRTRSYNTIDEHMPSNHRTAKDASGWTQAGLLHQAERIGENVKQVVQHIISSSIYPEQNFKAANAVMMLEKTVGTARLQAACIRALSGTRVTYGMIKNILEKGMDKQALNTEPQLSLLHENLRGPESYQ